MSGEETTLTHTNNATPRRRRRRGRGGLGVGGGFCSRFKKREPSCPLVPANRPLSDPDRVRGVRTLRKKQGGRHVALGLGRGGASSHNLDTFGPRPRRVRE